MKVRYLKDQDLHRKIFSLKMKAKRMQYPNQQLEREIIIFYLIIILINVLEKINLPKSSHRRNYKRKIVIITHLLALKPKDQTKLNHSLNLNLNLNMFSLK